MDKAELSLLYTVSVDNDNWFDDGVFGHEQGIGPRFRTLWYIEDQEVPRHLKYRDMVHDSYVHQAVNDDSVRPLDMV
jgi:hypothetical protein